MFYKSNLSFFHQGTWKRAVLQRQADPERVAGEEPPLAGAVRRPQGDHGEHQDHGDPVLHGVPRELHEQRLLGT